MFSKTLWNTTRKHIDNHAQIELGLLSSTALFLYFFTGKTDDLVPYLNALQFRNGPSFVYANQSFGLQQFCVLYTEPENVSTIRFGWDTLGLRSYLFQNPGDPKMQRSPPMGMRSAVPLGGLGKSDLEVISYETWEKKTLQSRLTPSSPTVFASQSVSFGTWTWNQFGRALLCLCKPSV